MKSHQMVELARQWSEKGNTDHAQVLAICAVALAIGENAEATTTLSETLQQTTITVETV